jgi:hypothetical protein
MKEREYEMAKLKQQNMAIKQALQAGSPVALE